MCRLTSNLISIHRAESLARYQRVTLGNSLSVLPSVNTIDLALADRLTTEQNRTASWHAKIVFSGGTSKSRAAVTASFTASMFGE